MLLKSFTLNWFDAKKFAWQWISSFSTLCKITSFNENRNLWIFFHKWLFAWLAIPPPCFALVPLTWWNVLFINFEELSLPSFFNWLHPFSPHKKIWTFPYFSVSNVETKRFYSIVMGQTMFKLWCSNEYVWVCSMLKNDFRVCSMNNSVNPVKAF